MRSCPQKCSGCYAKKKKKELRDAGQNLVACTFCQSNDLVHSEEHPFLSLNAQTVKGPGTCKSRKLSSRKREKKARRRATKVASLVWKSR